MQTTGLRSLDLSMVIQMINFLILLGGVIGFTYLTLKVFFKFPRKITQVITRIDKIEKEIEELKDKMDS